MLSNGIVSLKESESELCTHEMERRVAGIDLSYCKADLQSLKQMSAQKQRRIMYIACSGTCLTHVWHIHIKEANVWGTQLRLVCKKGIKYILQFLSILYNPKDQDFVTIKLRTRYSHDVKKLSKILFSSYDLGK